MRRILLLAPLALTLLPGGPAQAQFSGPPPEQRRAAPAPPPALPGIAARRAPEPIPADPNATNLSPTAALFDAITRGDLPAARDAVNRGASLEERNVLGLTAIDAAVDQGRNEILFFLLSARGAIRAPSAPAEAALTPAQRAARDRAARAEAERAARTATGGRGPRGPAPQTRPRLFANDGGAPRPEVGFLGFDAGRGAATQAERRQRRS